MSDILTPQKETILNIADELEEDLIVKVGRALSVPERVAVLRKILTSSKSLSTLAKELDIPSTSIARHVEILEESGLIYISYQPSQKGHIKYCSQAVKKISISLEGTIKEENQSEYIVEMPVGMFSHCHIKAPCGMTGTERIAEFDNPKIFFSPIRSKAECIWFDSGFVAYNFPANFSRQQRYEEISFSFEICSETVYYNNNWPSDITVRINDLEVLTFMSLGDFGGRRGKYTPNHWPVTSTQFGILRKISVNKNGVFLDNAFISDKITFDDLSLYDGNAIKLEIGVKDDAVHKGGLNLFGKNFGDYPQAIIMSLK